MAAPSRVIQPALDAARAAEIFARNTRPSARVNQLTVADHGHVLAALCEALDALSGKTGVLCRSARLAAAHAPAPLDYHGYAATQIRSQIDHASRDANTADIRPARIAVRAHVRILDAAGHRHAQATPARNVHLARARGVSQAIWALAGTIPAPGTMTDLDWALRGTCDIFHSLRTACRSQAALLNVAYEAAGIGRRAAPVNDTLNAAATALGHACDTLMCAQHGAQQEAQRLRSAG